MIAALIRKILKSNCAVSVGKRNPKPARKGGTAGGFRATLEGKIKCLTHVKLPERTTEGGFRLWREMKIHFQRVAPVLAAGIVLIKGKFKLSGLGRLGLPRQTHLILDYRSVKIIEQLKLRRG